MDTLGVLNHLSNVMTIEEWQQFKDTEEYLWMMARVEGYRGASMKKLSEAGTRQRAEAWEIARDMANSIIKAEIAELPLDIEDTQVQVLIERLAEKLMVEQNLTPPTFTSWSDCSTCGRVPVPDGTEALTPNCPWCQV